MSQIHMLHARYNVKRNMYKRFGCTSCLKQRAKGSFHFFLGPPFSERLQGQIYKQLLDKSNCYLVQHKMFDRILVYHFPIVGIPLPIAQV